MCIRDSHKLMQEAGDLIAAGELVEFPTETVYGLGGDALDPEASKKIYSAKAVSYTHLLSCHNIPKNCTSPYPLG